jgi:hypothetical protein
VITLRLCRDSHYQKSHPYIAPGISWIESSESSIVTPSLRLAFLLPRSRFQSLLGPSSPARPAVRRPGRPSGWEVDPVCVYTSTVAFATSVQVTFNNLHNHNSKSIFQHETNIRKYIGLIEAGWKGSRTMSCFAFRKTAITFCKACISPLSNNHHNKDMLQQHQTIVGRHTGMIWNN